MTWRPPFTMRLCGGSCRSAVFVLLLSLGALGPCGAHQAAADTRTETLRILVRAKSAIEVGVSARDFATLVRQIDEQIEMVRLTKPQDVTAAQLQAAAAALTHLKGIASLWIYLNEQRNCQDRYGFYDVVQDRSCRARLVELLSSAGLKLTDVSMSETSVHPQSIIQEALQTAHQQLTSAIGKFATR